VQSARFFCAGVYSKQVSMSIEPPLPARPAHPQTRGMWRFFGCLGLVFALPAVLVLLVLGGILPKSMIPILLRLEDTSAFNQETSNLARSSKALQEALGLPMEETSLQGNVYRSEGRTHGTFQLRLEGPKDEATVRALATRAGESSKWNYTVFEAKLEDGSIIDLKPQ
jgi:hypothetical protein